MDGLPLNPEDWDRDEEREAATKIVQMQRRPPQRLHRLVRGHAISRSEGRRVDADTLLRSSLMSIAEGNRFSAAGSALGYLAQVEYALLIALQRMDSDDSLRLSLETVDDITFDSDGKSRELWQTKHQGLLHG